tara:strand:+ start:495 stop:671 length:177 start_codon:yes stop_codon:yes gene_type:complete
MFNKEKMIDGVLNYRNTLNEDFKPYTLEELSKKFLDVESENIDLANKLLIIKDCLQDF